MHVNTGHLGLRARQDQGQISVNGFIKKGYRRSSNGSEGAKLQPPFSPVPPNTGRHTLSAHLMQCTDSTTAAAGVASVVSNSVRPHGRQPTRLPRPWDSPGRNPGAGCHCLLQCTHACSVASVVSDSLRPHRRQPSRLLRPWDSPGKNTGVGCHFLLQCMKVKSESEVAQSCPTLSDPMDCSLPGSSVHGIFQARVLEWGAIALTAIVISSPELHSL